MGRVTLKSLKSAFFLGSYPVTLVKVVGGSVAAGSACEGKGQGWLLMSASDHQPHACLPIMRTPSRSP